MNNFGKYCAFFNHFSSWALKERGDSKHKRTYEDTFLHVKGLSSTFGGPFFSFQEPFSLLVCGSFFFAFDA